MAIRLRVLFLLVVIPVAALAARRQNPHALAKNTMARQNWTELMGNMDTMHAAMDSIKPSGNSDKDFVKLMLPHHQGAVDMAKTELMYGNDPQMRRLAQEIITDQESEIQLMQLWLKRRGDETSKPGTK